MVPAQGPITPQQPDPTPLQQSCGLLISRIKAENYFPSESHRLGQV